MAGRIRIKRAYEPPQPGDGVRVLVERLWPRGIRKEAARIDFWPKEIAPSTALRKRFHADPDAQWDAFQRDYRAELHRGPAREALAELRERIAAMRGPVTLVFGSKDEARNSAVVLREVLERGP